MRNQLGGVEVNLLQMLDLKKPIFLGVAEVMQR
jgi:hypothetical protein